MSSSRCGVGGAGTFCKLRRKGGYGEIGLARARCASVAERTRAQRASREAGGLTEDGERKGGARDVASPPPVSQSMSHLRLAVTVEGLCSVRGCW